MGARQKFIHAGRPQTKAQVAHCTSLIMSTTTASLSRPSFLGCRVGRTGELSGHS